MFSDENLKGRLEVSEAMMSYWAGFAHKGTPGAGLLGTHPEWKPYGRQSRLMVFDTEAGGGIRLVDSPLDAARILANIASDRTLEKDDWRCRVYSYMQEKGRFVSAKDLGRLGCQSNLSDI